MKKNIKIENYIFSVIFLIAMFSLSILSATNTLPKLKEIVVGIVDEIGSMDEQDMTVEAVSGVVSKGLLQIDSSITENVYNRYMWIEAYGTVNRLLGKKEINGFSYAVDENGAYNSVNFWADVRDQNVQRYAQQLLLFKQSVEEKGSKFIFLAFPNKYDEAWNSGYYGIPYNGYNSHMDELLLWNRRYGIDCIDFREVLEDSGLTFKDMFYRTDHHWTAYAAFLSFKELVAYMNEEFGENLDEDGFYRDINNYEIEWLEDMYLGSSGRNVGISFAGEGLEDFQVMKPKFSLNITTLSRRSSTTRPTASATAASSSRPTRPCPESSAPPSATSGGTTRTS